MSKWGNKPITKDNILFYITEYDIFKYYCTPFAKLGEAFCSELRKDNRPTCYIINYNSKLLYKDFADKSHDCFSYIMEKYKVSFKDCLQTIVSDFRLPLGFEAYKTFTNGFKASIELNKSILENTKKPTEIEVFIRKWSMLDKKYWFDNYQITSKELAFFKVYPLTAFKINDTYIKGDTHCYGYYFGLSSNSIHQWKIYQPYSSKGNKWFSNCEKGNLQGYDQLNWLDNLLIITKSLKDVIVLHKLGINAVAPHGEGHHIEESLIHSLTHRFQHISILYDNDSPGVNASTRISELYNLDNIIIPFEYGDDVKDVSDLVKNNGYNELYKFLASHYTKLGIELRKI
jgi:hypothetical protein